MHAQAQRAARDVLDRLAAQDPVGYYNQPVDVAYLPGYSTVVKRPMDLGTIRGKLATYATVDAFAADARRPARTNEKTNEERKRGERPVTSRSASSTRTRSRTARRRTRTSPSSRGAC